MLHACYSLPMTHTATATEYGIFSDEGCVESAIHTEGDARDALAEHQADAVKAGANPALLFFGEVCPDHEEQPRDGCEECYAEHDADAED